MSDVSFSSGLPETVIDPEPDEVLGALDDALKAGDLARYQSDVNKGADLVRQAQQQAGANSAPATTPTSTVPA